MILNFSQEKYLWSMDQSNANYDTGNEFIYNTELLSSNHCDCKWCLLSVEENIETILNNKYCSSCSIQKFCNIY